MTSKMTQRGLLLIYDYYAGHADKRGRAGPDYVSMFGKAVLCRTAAEALM
jgi:hypothetical protein